MPAGHNSGRTGGSGRETADFDALLRAAKQGRPSAWDDLYHDLAPAIAGYLRLRARVRWTT